MGSLGGHNRGLRFELFRDRPPQLQRLVHFLSQQAAPAVGGGPLRVNIPNKRPDQATGLLEAAACVVQAVPRAEVCLHYSLKYQPGGVERFRDFCHRAGGIPGCSVLLVSGTGRRKLDAAACLEQLARQTSRDELPPIGVAFSPFEPSSDEQARLLRKLRSGIVSEVWLQLGADLGQLREGLDFLAQLSGIRLYGSVFLPTKALLAKQRARPWAGVYLSDEYLGSIEGAERITRQVLDMYAGFGVTPLLESQVEDAEALASLLALFRSARGPRIVQLVAEEMADSAQKHDRSRCWRRRFQAGDEAEPQPLAPVPAAPLEASGSGFAGGARGLLEPIAVLSGDSDAESWPEDEPEAAPAPVAGTASRAVAAPGPSGRGTAVVWFRQDMRTHDHPALLEASRQYDAVVPVFIWAPEDEGGAPPGGAAQIWLRESLRALSQDLHGLGAHLVLRRGRSYADVLTELVREVGAKAVYFNRRYEPWGQQVDRQVAQQLASDRVGVREFPGYLLYEPQEVSVGAGYTVGHWGTLMPFYKACLAMGRPRRPLPTPERLASPSGVRSLTVDSLGLDSGVAPGGENWGASIRRAWPQISQAAALEQLRGFVRRRSGLQAYEKQRSRADLEENPNSKLSAFIRWGQLSPHDLFWAVQDAGLPREETKTFGRRLFWRDLAYFQLHHFPGMRMKAIRAHYDSARWRADRGLLRRWQRGLTGYPLVDAASRELIATGWVQQNVRMVAASFLTEFLNISWTEGVKWYEDQLVDADLAINSMMWQNAGRSGIDQWNFLISPVEAKAQDPTGAYTRRWVPELAALPTRFLHRPWEAPPDVLVSSGVCLGKTYPHRCVTDLQAAREEAKQATLDMRRGIAGTWMNDRDGYDVIALPSGQRTKVFTKLEYRLSKAGELLNPHAMPSKNAGKGKGKGRSKGKARDPERLDAGPAPKAKRTSQDGWRQASMDSFAACAPQQQRRWARLPDRGPPPGTIDLDCD